MPKTTRFVDYEPVTRRRPTPSSSDRDHVETLVKAAPQPVRRDAEDLLGDDTPTDTPWPPNKGRGLIRGHTLSYCGLLIFTIILYFRPQEYVPGLASVPIALIAAIVMLLAFIPSQLALEGSLTTRPREVNLLLLLCVASLLSVPLAVSPGDAIHTFWDPFLKAVIVFIIIVNAVRTERRLKVMFYLAFAVTCALCFSALNDYRLGNLTVEGYRIAGAFGGMFENTNDLGIHLATMFPLALMLGFAARNFLGKMFYWAIALVTLATLVVTFSRGAFLGLLASILVMSWKLARRRRGVVIISLIIGALVFIAAVPGTYGIRILSIFDPSLDPFGSSTVRSQILAHSFLMALRHPLLGIGIGNYPLVSARSLVTHNSYTQVAVEMGMGALFLYSMFLTAPLNRLKKIERETLKVPSDSRFYYIAVGLQGSLVGFMFSSFFAAVAYYWFIYYLVGYAVCFRRIYEAQTSENYWRRDVQNLNRKQ
jgi:O-antigen ligase